MKRSVYYLGLNLRKFRQRRGLTQTRVAPHIGCTTKQLSSWEWGRTIPRIDYIIKLADFYNVTLDELFEEV